MLHGANSLLSIAAQGKFILPALLLVVFWTWETWRPFFDQRRGRLRHGARNLVIAISNAVVLIFTLGMLTAWVADWSQRNEIGLLHSQNLSTSTRWIVSIFVLDAWMYVWHRANHAVPFLWRFHRMHHSDNRMDVTTATRFHIGEHLGGGTIRLFLIPLFGLSIWQIMVYETLVIAITQFHHANLSIGRLDRYLRLLIVTPDMHKVHHSRWRPETDSNYSTLFSFWDRLARSFRMRGDVRELEFGLDQFGDSSQSVWGMLKTPFLSNRRAKLQERRSVNSDEKIETHETQHRPRISLGATDKSL